MKNAALTVAGIIFSLVALVHLLRLIMKFQIMVESTTIPLWVNVIGLIVTGSLAIWMFAAANKK